MSHVVVVGAGVIGRAVAWRLAGLGLEVTVVDPDPGSGASRVAAGMLAPVAEAGPGEEAVTALNLAAAARWGSFAAALADASGRDPGYTAQGTLLVARDHDDRDAIEDLGRLHAAAGLTSVAVTSREARRLEPALGPATRGGRWLADDHQVDNRLLLAALDEAGRRAGVQLVAERAVHITAGSVVTDGGTVLSADDVVVATGAAPVTVEAGSLAVSPPVRPVKGQILRLRATASAVLPTRTVRGTEVYVVPRSHGEIVVGATVEERGPDTSVTAGAVLDLLRAARELLPGLAEAAFVEAAAGLRPGTPDNVPVVGRAGTGGTGPVLAVGHYRHGILLAPLTADLVARLVAGDAGRPGDDVLATHCDPRRPALTGAAAEPAASARGVA